MDLSAIMNPTGPPRPSSVSSKASPRHQDHFESPKTVTAISPLRSSNDSAVTSSPSAPSSANQMTKSPAKRAHSLESSSPVSHKPKRIKREPPPIFAQTPQSSRKPPVPLWQSLPRTVRSQTSSNNVPRAERAPENGTSAPRTSSNTPDITNGVSKENNTPSREPSIFNVIPHEEITREISNFLFKEVVMREDFHGIAVEVEAKIGQIIDRTTNDRIRLPAVTETLLSQGDPSLRIGFKSSMSLAQHKFINETLNNATKMSMAPGRRKIAYKHRHECDAFYELSQPAFLGLPAPIRQCINARHNPRLRVTTDKKTGEVLAKIVKARVCDIHVYSPQTLYDYRISVNLEMDFEGDYAGFEKATEKGNSQDRNKDRLSYSHQEYQIDLTQVTPPDSTAVEDKEHELEVEISSKALKEQGELARQSRPTFYEDLVRGFVDNIRTLTRSIKQ